MSETNPISLLASGAEVTVTLENDTQEHGLVVTRAANPVTYLVRFDDQTESWWPAFRVAPLAEDVQPSPLTVETETHEITIKFTTSRPLTEEERETILFNLQLSVTEPCDDNGDALDVGTTGIETLEFT